jgi:hypothetical protein
MLEKNTLVGAVVLSLAVSGSLLAQLTFSVGDRIRIAEDLTPLGV